MTRSYRLAVGSRLAVLGILLATAACGGGGGDGGDGGPSRDEQILQIVSAAGKVVPLGPDSDVVVATETLEEGDYRNTYEQHDAIANLEGVAYMGLNDDLIWPGALVKGTHAHDFVYEPISVARGPLTISVSLEGAGGGGTLFHEVSDPRLSTMRQGIAELLASAITPGTTVPARVDYREEQVTNVSHMNLFVGADVSYGAGSLSTRFDWNSTEKRTKVLVKYTQIYYTVDIDMPARAVELFGPQVAPGDVAAAMPPGSLPLYVASVGYGMMAIMCIETDFTEEEMKLALDAAYAGTVTAKVVAGYTAKDILERSSITVIVYGGSTKGLADVETGYAGFQKVLDASKEYGADTPGVPIVYKFRHVSDNTLALVSLTSQYTVVRPLQLRQRVQVTATKFVCNWADDEWTEDDDSVDMDRFYVWANGRVRNDPGEVGTLIYPSDQRVYSYEGGEVPMAGGSIFWVVGSAVLVYDTEHYDFSISKLSLRAKARDLDNWASADEWGENTIELLGNQFFEGGGERYVPLFTADFGIDAYVAITDATR